MSKGRRYNAQDNKINVKKVIAVAITLIVIIMFVILVAKMLESDKKNDEKAVALSYHTVYDNGKWGVINSQAEEVIKPQYDEIIIIPNPDKDVFIVNYNVNYETGEYETKAINSKNKELFTDYDSVEVIQNQDKQNSVWYVTNCLKVSKNGKYGLIDLAGKQLLDCQYDDIAPMLNVKNSLITIKDNQKGLVSTTGTVIINNEYTEIEPLTDEYEDGYIVKNSEGKYGVIGTNKKTLVNIEYDGIKNIKSNENYVVSQNGKMFIINSTSGEKNELSKDISDVKTINDTNVIVKKADKYGIISTDGTEKVEAKYQDLSYAFSSYYIAKLDDKYGIIDSEGTTKLEFNYTNLTYRKDADFIEGQTENSYNSDLIDRSLQVKLTGIISEVNTGKGYMKIRVGSEYKYYNFKFEEKKNIDILTTNTLFLDKKDGKYGYVDKNGIVIVNYIYDDATEQNDFGYVAVKQNGKWGALNQKGEVVVEPTLSLDNNAVISFIGTWHLAEDVNAGYYIK